MTWNERGLSSRVVKAATVKVRGDEAPPRDPEELVAEAHEAGYRQGVEDGFQAGALQAGAQLADAADRLVDAVCAEVSRLRAELAAQRELDAAQIVELAMTVAEWVARRELSSVPDAFFGRLEELLSDRDRHAQVELTVAPELVEATRVWLDNPDMRVFASDELAVGEARVTIGDSTVFATFADAFNQARDVLANLASPFAETEEPFGDIESVEVLYDATEYGA